MKRTREADEETKGDSNHDEVQVDDDGGLSEGYASNASTDYAHEEDHDSGEEEGSVEARRRFVVGSFDDVNEAFAAHDQRNSFVYSYDNRYVSATTQGQIFNYISHVQCGHRLKIKTAFRGAASIDEHRLWEGGVHSLTVVRNLSRHGISPAVRRDVDHFIRLGFGATTVCNMDQKFRGDATMLKLVPDRGQIENRKAYMKKNLDEALEITIFATFNAWVSSRICRNRDEFVSISDLTDHLINKMILLDTFVIAATNDTPPSFGVIATSRRLFRNVSKMCLLLCVTKVIS